MNSSFVESTYSWRNRKKKSSIRKTLEMLMIADLLHSMSTKVAVGQPEYLQFDIQ